MQSGEVGLAADYVRRSWVLRVRAEGHQFLLACQTQASMLHWYAAIREAIAISLPLDSREEPRVEKLPRKTPAPSPLSAWDSISRNWREKWNRRSAHRVWLQDTHGGSTDEAACGSHLSVSTTSIKDKKMPDELGEKADEIKRVALAAGALRSTQRVVRATDMQSRQHQQLDYACRCAHKISYALPWESKWYIRDGCVVPTDTAVEISDIREWVKKSHLPRSKMTPL